ncbi:hypothetical protein DUNSADRAFT_5879 [Dunaliella salina]|uniref:3'-5' exonuclease n=1 Tax=Dunaliella salina TaxID=3046 RepID=A0ABQ7GPG5_DUNSA|nr:hypothetical protein DUNSADRAFT_5879 [Dunaliella salina]|eukprot:KAF5836493.1 hypothetical protein DUNSADRAFT_5879 [Dunaliella salina]
MPTDVCVFDGELVYANNASQVRAACTELLQIVASLQPQGKSLVLGFDMEWQYMPECPPALIQLCVRIPPAHGSQACDSLYLEGGASKKRQKLEQAQHHTCSPATATFRCYLLHIACLGEGMNRAHPSLKELLEHPNVFLATIAGRDEEKLANDLGVYPANLEQVNMAHFLLIQEQAAAAAAAPQAQGNEHSCGAPRSLSQKAAAQTKRQRRRQQQRQHHLLDELHPQQQGKPQQAPMLPQRHLQKQEQRGVPHEAVSLASLVGWHLGKRIDKSCQLSNEKWEAAQLDEKCMRYAATDAYATLLVFEEIRRKLRPLLAARNK